MKNDKVSFILLLEGSVEGGTYKVQAKPLAQVGFRYYGKTYLHQLNKSGEWRGE